jgi:hypothetical protein
MKFTIAILLAILLGWQIGASITAARDVTKAEKATCRAKVML